MFGIKKHVLQLGNSMVASDKSFELNHNKTLKPLKLANLANFGPAVACFISKSLYLSWEFQWWPLISHLNQTKTNHKKPWSPENPSIQYINVFSQPIAKFNTMHSTLLRSQWCDQVLLNELSYTCNVEYQFISPFRFTTC